ncbi:monocarboxylate transporter [Culex quinquefasciatus]|uniref:Monocarboxylate transporter n=1 Tax=Culex quinquefasciatus TaxID=7176 RepID=B0WAR7_CULQU|nr:monocarboxylate transporter [Culex quinquefasciatus]|eukprot:XP_001845801.1 monocarboxylate transporter [Culex quinquefasciatus]
MIMIIPVLQSFGLIFKDTFQQINISATDASLIINLASAVGMTFGLFNGPLLRSYGFRRVAFLGGTMFSLGLMLTSSAETFTHFIITYSIIASLGMGFCNSSFSLALNTYFVARRNKAAGIAMTITGLGPILLPQLVSLLVSRYGSRNCLLIIGALATHIMVAALLLQPVKRHMVPAVEPSMSPAKPVTPPMIAKPVQIPVEKSALEEAYSVVDALNPKAESRWELDSDNEDDYLERQNFMDNYNIDAQSIYGFEQTTQPRHRDSLQVIPPTLLQLARAKSEVLTIAQRRPSMAEMLTYKTYFPEGVESSPLGNGGSRLQTIPQSKVVSDDQSRLPSIIRNSPDAVRPTSPKTTTFDLSQVDSAKKVPPSSSKQTFLQKLVSIFDLTLLKDKIYVNMMLGMSIAVFAEINFSLLTPFILNDLGYQTEQIASVMSTLAMTDLLFRFISPFVGDFLKLKPRVMYMIALTMLIVTRFSILLARNYTEMLVVAFFLGVAKGVRTVYMGLVIPSYIPIKRLPAASSIQMMTNGIILMTIGPLVGLIRDLSGSYSKSILFINVFTMVTLAMWAVEMVYVRRKVSEKEVKGEKVATEGIS